MACRTSTPLRTGARGVAHLCLISLVALAVACSDRDSGGGSGPPGPGNFDTSFGGSALGEWINDEFGLPAFRYHGCAAPSCAEPADTFHQLGTGSLTGVSGLSGYVTDADGRLLVFSIVLNNYLASSVKNLEDQIAIALASYTGRTTTATRGTPPTAPDAPRTPEGIECSWQKPITC